MYLKKIKSLLFSQQFLRFLGVGVLNTLVTLIVIQGLMLLGVDYKWSNLLGYLVGVINSFVWNKYWVFQSSGRVWKESLFFSLVFIFCYGLQFCVLYVLVEQLHFQAALSQVLAMGTYTLVNFILNHMFAFRTQ